MLTPFLNFLPILEWQGSLDRSAACLNSTFHIIPGENAMKKIIVFTVCVFCLCLIANAAEVRTWTSADGKFKIDAELVKVSEDGKSVTLRQKDGKESVAKLEKLSQEDSEYVTKQNEEDNPFEDPGNENDLPSKGKPNPPRTMPKNFITQQQHIDAILSKVDDADDRNTVEKWLTRCTLKCDKLDRIIPCIKEFPPRTDNRPNSFLRPGMDVHLNTGQVFGYIYISTCDRGSLESPIRIRVTDRSGDIWESSKSTWKESQYGFTEWYKETKLYTIGDEIPEDEVDRLIETIVKNDRCIIRVYGDNGRYRDISISSQDARDFRVLYEAYKVLRKYY